MNYFAHALPFLDNPYFAAGTGVPDWLTVVDRPVRVRLKHARAMLDDPDSHVAAVAGGIVQHLLDDARFHESRAFVEASLELTVHARDALGGERGFRPSFLGHLLVEVLLDAVLAEADVARLEAYYAVLDQVEPAEIESAVNRMAPRPTARLAMMISAFRHHRIIWDYFDDARLMVRLNQVMRRVRFAELPDEFREILPAARRTVAARAVELLEGIPVPPHE